MSATASASGASLAPNSVLYFQNLDEKVKKAPLRQALLHACAPFGQVKAVHALKTNKMRGQAFVYFGDAAEAALALRDLQGQQLFTKPMKVAFARLKGEAAAPAAAAAAGAAALGSKRRRPDAAAGAGDAASEGDDAGAAAPTAKRPATESAAALGGAAAAAAAALLAAPAGGEGGEGGAPAAPAPPHRMLLASGLPAELTDAMLVALFGRFPGLKDVRMLAERGLAFIEYEELTQAAAAMQALHGFRLTAERAIAVTYARQ